MLILVDAMGGDNAPDAIVNGCIDAIHESEGYDIQLIGDSEKINKIINEKKVLNPRLKVLHASEVITNEDSPVKALKSKKDSSMVVGLTQLKEKKGDVFISAGNTGALMAGSLFILGRIEGVDRPALAPVIPNRGEGFLLIDAGANTMCKPINYMQFGIMGSIFMEEVFRIENPKVGLINVGSEEKKGNETIKQAHTLLSSANINFIGNVEGRQLPDGKVHVAVCDGFMGNVLLKFIEGIGSFFFDALKDVFSKNIITKLAAFALRKGLKKLKKSMDDTEYGGAPLLGVNGKVLKSHGNSNAKAIKNTVIKACSYAKSSVTDKIREEFRNMEVEEIE